MRPDTARSTRRTEGTRPHGRGERVVDTVLAATMAELTRVGYAALRVEDVALRSGVNKTTIYRRWPSKMALVSAAIEMERTPVPVPDTGELRADLWAHLTSVVSYAQSPLGAGLIRVILAERTHPEMEPIMQVMRERKRHFQLERLRRAVERGELPANANPELIADLLFSPVFSRVCNGVSAADDTFIDELLDIVLLGVEAAAAKSRPAAQRRDGSAANA